MICDCALIIKKYMTMIIVSTASRIEHCTSENYFHTSGEILQCSVSG